LTYIISAPRKPIAHKVVLGRYDDVSVVAGGDFIDVIDKLGFLLTANELLQRSDNDNDNDKDNTTCEGTMRDL
jgi:hypothetical protein